MRRNCGRRRNLVMAQRAMRRYVPRGSVYRRHDGEECNNGGRKYVFDPNSPGFFERE